MIMFQIRHAHVKTFDTKDKTFMIKFLKTNQDLSITNHCRLVMTDLLSK